ncbi:hypothetical protein G7Y89_g12644 [Cudoniella acicularis]|uniref:Rhodopsin domain-containing protein n=1 Tax=Cudoniella acicularis TaxID=354080 RepID=A0A8H4RC77_9HELO|nr:hypothetical protein G7Y89_g12644 [Cudoniella acicularis]
MIVIEEAKLGLGRHIEVVPFENVREILLCVEFADVYTYKDRRFRHFPPRGFVIVSSAMRIYFMLNMDIEDMTWTYVGVGLWTAIEINVAVISACLPTLQPVLSYIIPSFLSKVIPSTKSKVSNAPSKDIYLNTASNRARGEEFQRLPEYAMDSISRENS